MKVHNLVVTGSLQSSGENLTFISSSVASTVTNLSSSITASMGSLSSSMATSMTNLSSSLTSSMGSLSSSIATSMNNLSSSMGGMVATTGSNVFIGSQTISGSIIPAVNGIYDLGSSTHEFRHLYLSSASLYIDGTKVLGSTTQELQITTDTGQSFKILEAGSDTITLQSADGNITLATSGGGDVILDPTTGVIALKGTTTIYAGNRVLSSDGNAIQFGNSVTMTGSLVVTGFIETQELRTTYISSSILYRSGSTKFGDELGDTHSFTGSLLISGSLIATSITGSLFGTSSESISSSYPFVGNGSTVRSFNTSNNSMTESFIVGLNAGYNATGSWDLTAIGTRAAYQGYGAESLIAIGYQAGYQAEENRYSIFLGQEAGYQSTTYGSIYMGLGSGYGANADSANFIGYNAGIGATRADYSNFIGVLAGHYAENASGSNFIGGSSGKYQTGSAYSNYIGYNVANNRNSANYLGRNNIIIGNSLTLPTNSKDSINIGGLIFGSGSHWPDNNMVSDPFPFSGSANGKIGINQPSPQFNFDVSGSGRFTNGLTITGSLTVSGSISVPGSGLVSGSSQVISLLPSGVVSGSVQVDVMSTTNIARLATTGSNIFTSAQIISSSLSMPIELWHPDGNGIRFRNAGASGKRWDLVSSGDNFVLNETGVSGRLFVSSSGFFGLNTNSPTEMLHVYGSGSATSIKVETATNHATFFEASAFTGTTKTRLQSNSSAGFVGTMTSHPFDIFSGNAFAARYNTNGNLNVGYQGDQGAKLYVQANIASYAAYIEQVGGATSSYGGLRVTTNSTGVYSLRIDNAGTEIFSVKGGGIVYAQNALGIGYSDPQYSLQVNGSIGLRANSQNIKAITGTGWGYSPSSYKVVMLGDTANNVTVSIGYDPSGNANGAFSGTGGEVLFRNGASFATPNAANTSFNLNTLVMKDGKVGIAKADPAYTLEVNGDAKFVSNSSARVLYLKQNANNSGNIIQFQNENNSDIWEVVGRNNQFYIYNTSQSVMSIYVNPTTNNVGIGSSGTDHRLDVNGNIRINQSVAYLYFTSTTTNRYLAYNGADTYWRADGVHYFEKTSGYKGSWDANGNLTVTGTITESSAKRYKENIKLLENSLDKIIKLRGVSYNKIETGDKEIGLIAEEVNEILPELITKNANGEIESVAYGRVVSVLIEAIKELKIEIEELKNK